MWCRIELDKSEERKKRLQQQESAILASISECGSTVRHLAQQLKGLEKAASTIDGIEREFDAKQQVLFRYTARYESSLRMSTALEKDAKDSAQRLQVLETSVETRKSHVADLQLVSRMPNVLVSAATTDTLQSF